MGKLRVKTNRSLRVAKAMAEAPQGIADGCGQVLVDELKQGAMSTWNSATIAKTVANRSKVKDRAAVSVGLNRALGFYSRFLEWGTVHNHARPMVTPTVERSKAQLEKTAADVVRKAAKG